MKIPEIGQWIEIAGKDLGPGKVTQIMFDRNACIADFLVEPDYNGVPQTEECEVRFGAIERLITDKDEIRKLEEEAGG